MDLSLALEHWARSAPHRIAVASAEEELMFLQLLLRAQNLAAVLHPAPEPRVGIWTRDPVAMAIGFHAAVLAGKSLVMLDPAWPKETLRSMAARLGAQRAITSSTEEGTLRLPDLETLPVPASHPGNLRPIEAADPNRELLVIGTSGSGGQPKAVVRSQASWQDSLSAGAGILGAMAGAVTLCPGPISHGLGLYALVESLHTGGTLLSSGQWHQDAVQTLLHRYRCTRIVSVPAIISSLLDTTAAARLSRLTTVVSGGEALPAATVNRIYGQTPARRCTEYYGSSEHSLISYRHRHPEEEPSDTFTFTPFPGVKVHVHSTSPCAGRGAIFIDSPFNAHGYDSSDASTIDRCGDSTGIGDMGRLLGDGRLELDGRGGAMLNLNGNNVHPAEIAHAFARLGIEDVQIRLAQRGGRKSLLAYTCTDPVPERHLGQLLQQLLPSYKIPHTLIHLETWPTTASGKIAVSDLPETPTPNLTKVHIR